MYTERKKIQSAINPKTGGKIMAAKAKLAIDGGKKVYAGTFPGWSSMKRRSATS